MIGRRNYFSVGKDSPLSSSVDIKVSTSPATSLQPIKDFSTGIPIYLQNMYSNQELRDAAANRCGSLLIPK